MKLTLQYQNTPESAKIVSAETGEELEGVQSFELKRSRQGGFDELTLKVNITPSRLLEARTPLVSDT